MLRTLVGLTGLGLLVLLAPPATAELPSGPYVAARVAMVEGDFREAAALFDRALAQDPDNPVMLEQSIIAHLALGELEPAAASAWHLDAQGKESQFAEMAIVADLAMAGDFDGLAERVRSNRALGPLTAGLIEGWAELGRGDMKAATAVFDRIGGEAGLKPFADLHKALAHAHVGDFEAAANLFASSQDEGGLVTRRSVLARAEVLSRLGRHDEAIGLLDRTFGADPDPMVLAIRERLSEGEELAITHVTSVRDGVAEVFYTLASALRDEADPDYTLLYARLARLLRPDHVEASLMVADLFERIGQHSLAIEAYEAVPRDSFAWPMAALGRAQAMYAAGRTDAAIEALRNLAETHGNLANVQAGLGDLLRRERRYEEAIEPYTRAIEIEEGEGRPYWFSYYARGIVHERSGMWEKAEADFRRALELSPDQPQVLNYLGYSLVVQGRNLDEALGMIEKAVEKRPDSGYIVDSLGWVFYQLGRYDEAVEKLERAVELEPVDPILNDHLGDAYWAVGRKREARFQWTRALNFVTDDTDLDELKPDRVRRKLEIGLDAVLAEEGAPPLKLANGDD